MEKNLPEETKRIIDSILAPYGTSLEQISSKPEVKPSLDTVYLSISQATDYTHLCRWTIWQHAKKGSFRTLKTGKARRSRVLIDKKSLDKWLDSLAR